MYVKKHLVCSLFLEFSRILSLKINLISSLFDRDKIAGNDLVADDDLGLESFALLYNFPYIKGYGYAVAFVFFL